MSLGGGLGWAPAGGGRDQAGATVTQRRGGLGEPGRRRAGPSGRGPPSEAVPAGPLAATSRRELESPSVSPSRPATGPAGPVAADGAAGETAGVRGPPGATRMRLSGAGPSERAEGPRAGRQTPALPGPCGAPSAPARPHRAGPQERRRSAAKRRVRAANEWSGIRVTLSPVQVSTSSVSLRDPSHGPMRQRGD